MGFRDSREESYLLLGTSTGHIQVHGSDGQLLHRQRLHTRAVTAVAVRCAGMQAGAGDSSEDITICFEDAVARFSSLEVSTQVSRHALHDTPCLGDTPLRKCVLSFQGHQDGHAISTLQCGLGKYRHLLKDAMIRGACAEVCVVP